MQEKGVREFLTRVTGQTVTFRRLAGNTLILYLNCNPDDHHGYSIWLEPTWHFANTRQVLVGSRQAQVEEAKELDEICQLMDVLDNKKIESISIDTVSHDICILFAGGFIKTFVSDPTDDLIWYIKDRTNNLKLIASPSNVEIVSS